MCIICANKKGNKIPHDTTGIGFRENTFILAPDRFHKLFLKNVSERLVSA
jgi:hypothetical protein